MSLLHAARHALFLLALAGANLALAAEPAGTVSLAEGEVQVVHNQQVRVPRVGESVYAGDSVSTGASGELHLQMADGGYIAVRPNTRMQITRYRAEGDDQDESLIELARGSFRSVTGWIGKFNAPRYTVRTPTAVLGVRGTDHEPLVILEGGTEGEPGTYDKVNEGESFIETSLGRTSVKPNQAGFAPARRKSRPSVLGRVPAFFRPTRNEHRFKGLHQKTRPQLERQRNDKRKWIKERREKKTREQGPNRQHGNHDPSHEKKSGEKGRTKPDRHVQDKGRHGRKDD